MRNPSHGRKSVYSRRAVLAQIGSGGIAAALAPLGGVNNAFVQVDDRPWYFLDDAEARWLAAACDTLIPQDDFPSASQAGVVDFIDFQLATDYGVGNGFYMKGPHGPGTAEQGYQFAFPPSDLFRNAIAALLQEDPPLDRTTEKFLMEDSEAIYQGACAGCHQAQGEGAVGAATYPPLGANPRLEGAQYPVYILLNGMGAMPAFDDWLSDDQIVEVVTFLQQNFGNDFTNHPTVEMVAQARNEIDSGKSESEDSE